MGKREEDQGARLIRCGTGLLLGGVLALAVCCLFLLGCAAAVSGGLAGEELGYQFTIVGCVLGGFCGGLFAVRQCGGCSFCCCSRWGRCALRACPFRPGASGCCAAACAAALRRGFSPAGGKSARPGKNAENN